MARYRGPLSKIARKFGEPIFGPDKALERKNYPPGQHGFARKRGKKSEYAVQLAEKQKAKYTYGILERQFENLFQKANRLKGITGETLLQLCETRLDNVVYRLGIAPTRRAARQLVSHRHIEVNGEIVNIPSYQLKPGDVISVRQKSRSMDAINLTKGTQMDWLEWNSATASGRLLNVPQREQIPENIKEQLIVELYSK
ncbi:30S ribosomal protein S4 [Schleiferia thermophila]|jgi:small subunit ribosomal protein S4|uniref:Small ribosomal subunit protein uS4 n=1 Tax=Schleiferia thermophila TaxID=884107 RepID=A0A369A6R6_9FLAO|nr:30S ribosomal protein S4 [Schleiferia thermophila]KFD38342.1 30S ribosomal protein S4 [Schleiferia thermophila str. Yellowstone]RCX04843.1 SSU ribosomal protein S4P [Schleiferia thermophila]GCD79630.1 30S ribosomal protein S4 [Schleiferia thermophila]